ncbi:Wzz/FepE/Etk N-terminal domain-containing protein [Lacticaseibacillus paracasei]|uniref:YveK family protein n=1 Tax=Lacticaseibacillus paracasei TaxID=1597 RepID=UPI0003A00944|nr:Wzz/FepE/Etk N-terminal domain-containing protein [Lacticaseibacillus paracasei]MEA0972545.1 Wzz/FepE/Etk N-terminal domain-containing protein [Lacticaseibacillus paracasei]
MENLLSMKELMVSLRRSWWLALCTLLLGVAVAAGFAYGVMKPAYSSTALTVVNQQKNNTESVNQMLNQNQYDSELLATSKSLFKTSAVFDEASAQLLKKDNLNISSSDLQKQVKVDNEDNSRAFSIHATAKHSKDAALIANEMAAAFQKTIAAITNHNDTVTILAQATPSSAATSTKPMFIVVLGAVVGFLIGLAWIVLREIKKATIKTKETLGQIANAPVLGVITLKKL